MSLSIRSLLLPLALIFAAMPALAAAQPADAATCWQRVLSDWKDGHIDGTYSSSCLRAAIVHMPEDLKTYGDAEDDITRLLNAQTRGLAARDSARPTRASSGSRSLEGRKAKPPVRRVAAAPRQDASGGGFPYRTLLLILAAASAVSVLGVASVRGLRG